MNKRFLLFVFAAGMLNNTQNRAMETVNNPIGKTVLGALTLGAIGWVSNKVFDSNYAHELLKKAGVSPFAVKQVTFLSLSSLSLSYLSQGTDSSKQLFNLAWKAPIIGIVTNLINKQSFREMVGTVPFLGEYLSCPFAKPQAVIDEIIAKMNKEGKDTSDIRRCTTGCDHCKTSDNIRFYIAWTAIAPELIKIAQPYLPK